MKCLLDTCVFVWIAVSPERLSARAREALADRSSEFLLSDVSVLEVSLKWAAGKITLPQPPRLWMEEQARTWHASRLTLTRSAIYRSTELPTVHRDPFDRLLVATALDEEATIVTPDPWIHRYPASCLW